MKTSKIIYLLFALVLSTSAVVAQRSETRTPGTFNEIENSGVLDDPEVEEFLDKVDSVDLSAGSMTITPK